MSFPPLEGLSFRKKTNGSVVIDERKSEENPKYVGLIVSRVADPGYMLCPWLQKGLIFDKRIPTHFKSVQKAEQWVAAHAVYWNDKRSYTIFNPLINGILSDALLNSTLTKLRFQLILMQFLLSVVLFLQYSPNPTLQITFKMIAGVFCIAGIINIITMIREHL